MRCRLWVEGRGAKRRVSLTTPVLPVPGGPCSSTTGCALKSSVATAARCCALSPLSASRSSALKRGKGVMATPTPLRKEGEAKGEGNAKCGSSSEGAAIVRQLSTTAAAQPSPSTPQPSAVTLASGTPNSASMMAAAGGSSPAARARAPRRRRACLRLMPPARGVDDSPSPPSPVEGAVGPASSPSSSSSRTRRPLAARAMALASRLSLQGRPHEKSEGRDREGKSDNGAANERARVTATGEISAWHYRGRFLK